ncbi:unnamed protein product [Clonostachys byssicola]|uniref:Phosphoglycerate mutase family protein n=1 Tax=Clonostachys byssicola TaxID=160290 RepID=A0A9N9UUJ0_9HYPO|nr:unnamed protein product [Clonostachys byssicola]
MKALLTLLLASVVACKPTVYLIRHGEKPANGSNGLSIEGVERSQCLRNVFGKASGYNIDYILAQEYKPSGKEDRPYETVLPLSEDLGLNIDTHCDRDEPECVAKAVKEYKGDGNVLICWEHHRLTNITEALGVKDTEEYPSDRFDIIWTLSKNYKYIKDKTSEGCPGLDEKYIGEEQDFCEEEQDSYKEEQDFCEEY